MTESSEPSSLDQEARQLIRNKLLHYMRAHRIGVPQLAERIREVQTTKRKIPISTLQRFLAGIIRTTEPYVLMFYDFAEGLPSPDPIGSLGKAMAEYYGSQRNTVYVGEFESVMSYETAGDCGPLSAKLTITPDDRFYRVVEQSNCGRLLGSVADCVGI